jgi:hypothetical protein
MLSVYELTDFDLNYSPKGVLSPIAKKLKHNDTIVNLYDVIKIFIDKECDDVFSVIRLRPASGFRTTVNENIQVVILSNVFLFDDNGIQHKLNIPNTIALFYTKDVAAKLHWDWDSVVDETSYMINCLGNSEQMFWCNEAGKSVAAYLTKAQ